MNWLQWIGNSLGVWKKPAKAEAPLTPRQLPYHHSIHPKSWTPECVVKLRFPAFDIGQLRTAINGLTQLNEITRNKTIDAVEYYDRNQQLLGLTQIDWLEFHKHHAPLLEIFFENAAATRQTVAATNGFKYKPDQCYSIFIDMAKF